MTLCWLCGCPQCVIICYNICQGVSIRGVYPLHIVVQLISCFRYDHFRTYCFSFFCIHTSRSQVSLAHRIMLKPEHTETINQRLKFPNILLFSDITQLLRLNFSVSGYDEILYFYYRYCILLPKTVINNG